MLVAADVPAGDRDRIQGTWILVSSESDGVSRPAESLRAGKVLMIFEADRMTARMGDRSAVLGTFALDPTKTPKAYDRTYPDGSPRPGISELEGETLRICIAPLGKNRPTAFTTKPGDGRTLLVYKHDHVQSRGQATIGVPDARVCPEDRLHPPHFFASRRQGP